MYINTLEEYKALQALPLERKVGIAQARIAEWYNYWKGNVYVAFSGGKDSTVLLYLVRSMYPDVTAIFADTGLEYPEIRDFVKTFDNVIWAKPAKNFKKIIEEYGFPIISKDVAEVISATRRGNEPAILRLQGFNSDGTPSPFKQRVFTRYQYLLDAPFKISNRCCYYLKKNPFNRSKTIATRERGGGTPAAFVGMLGSESHRRKASWLKYGCNIYSKSSRISRPLMLWTEQDILQYIRDMNIPICSLYGDIVEDKNGKLKTTGADRTGCMFCMFGVHLEKAPNRFQRMAITHPKQWEYCINKLGCGKVLDYLGVDYRPTQEQLQEQRMNDLLNNEKEQE